MISEDLIQVEDVERLKETIKSRTRDKSDGHIRFMVNGYNKVLNAFTEDVIPLEHKGIDLTMILPRLWIALDGDVTFDEFVEFFKDKDKILETIIKFMANGISNYMFDFKRDF